MNDEHSLVHNLHSCENNTWKNSGLNRMQTHDLCDTSAVLYQVRYHGQREVLPFMGYVGMCVLKGLEYGFLAILVINKVLILTILVIDRVWFLHSSLELNMLCKKKLLFHRIQ